MDENKQVNNTSQQLGEPTEVKQSMKSDSPAQTNSNESDSEVTEQVTTPENVSSDTIFSPEDSVATTEKTEVETAALAELTQQIESLKVQLEERSTQYMRIAADFENYRKRTSKEKKSWICKSSGTLFWNCYP
ncbi:GrpE protein [Nodularia spumigena CCY9414]|nr:GrpE protein [Nodularia spumigena CCY9414]